jgi:two-component system, OmpR family, sensor kinase
MFRSIRWNLLCWQAVVLVAVVIGFGAVLFFCVQYATFEQVDADLLGAAQVVAAKMHHTESLKQVEIPEAYRHRFGKNLADAPYLVIWNNEGRVQLASDDAPADIPHGSELPTTDGQRPYDQRTRGLFREVIVRGPADSQILVGRQIGRERNEFWRLFWWLLGSGVGIVSIGLTWAWFLSRRILAPIEQMTATAERISVSNLSERIDESKIKSELGKLAQMLNQMFGRLQSSFERQTRFTADASHELRTPTSVIIIQSELALVKQRTPEEYQEALGACHRAAKRMQSLVEGLLTLARIDAGQMKSRHEPVDLKTVIENSVALLKPLSDRKQIELTCDLHSLQVSGDAERLGQVVANLVNNAITYNRDAGQVEVRLVAKDQNAVLTVSDTGIGIEESDLPKIFERFYRADQARTNNGGIGLGLSICREIVHSHGGTIEATSTVEERTIFTVLLPLRQLS